MPITEQNLTFAVHSLTFNAVLYRPGILLNLHSSPIECDLPSTY